ncbi:MAG: PAS domain-containing protein [Calditrichaeota bacterium]|nr:PAS domain-containing protein [Calditrichota bacterium]HQU74495.1 ATP-binding protein [Calditrichia bacterium]
MLLRNFRVKLVLRIAVILLTTVLIGMVLLRTEWRMAVLILILLLFWQIWELIRFVDKTNQDLERFFDAIRYSDFTQSFSVEGLGTSFDGLKAAFSRVFEAFQETRAEKAAQARYLETVVQHVRTGLIAFRTGDNRVILYNNAARRLLQLPFLNDLEGLRVLGADLPGVLESLPSGGRSRVSLSGEMDSLELVLAATEFVMGTERIRLVSLQDIRGDLDSRELEAWQKLIRVLTHEMMNSLTPIASLSATVRGWVSPGEGMSRENLEDLQTAMEAIRRRSEHLMTFVGNYRRLTRVPVPQMQVFEVAELFNGVCELFRRDLPAPIRLAVTVSPENLSLNADPALLEQVLINLVKNAAEAIGEKPGEIRLAGFLDDYGRVILQVRDNGPGIPPRVREQMFIPFFTTKPEGSGIGLSLCRQIIRQHAGSITAISRSGDTSFTMRF